MTLRKVNLHVSFAQRARLSWLFSVSRRDQRIERIHSGAKEAKVWLGFRRAEPAYLCGTDVSKLRLESIPQSKCFVSGWTFRNRWKRWELKGLMIVIKAFAELSPYTFRAVSHIWRVTVESPAIRWMATDVCSFWGRSDSIGLKIWVHRTYRVPYHLEFNSGWIWVMKTGKKCIFAFDCRWITSLITVADIQNEASNALVIHALWEL